MYSTSDRQACQLCGSNRVTEYSSDKKRDYLQCQSCALVFVPSFQYISPGEEKAQYDLHENNPNDPGYRKFLNRLLLPLLGKLNPGDRGLDFGSGPGPTLSRMFEEKGFPMRIYDLYYATDNSVFKKKYDFVTASETVEHLHNPGKDLEQLWKSIKPGGFLGIMTKLVTAREAFASWHYKNDLTHVSFFSRRTFTWLSAAWNAKLEFHGDDVIVIQKPCRVCEEYKVSE